MRAFSRYHGNGTHDGEAFKTARTNDEGTQTAGTNGEGTQTAGTNDEGTQTAGTYGSEALKTAGTIVKALRQQVL